MIRAYKGIRPSLGSRAWVDPSAQVIGAVELGDDASVWMNSVVRGDVNRIRLGARTNVQDSPRPARDRSAPDRPGRGRDRGHWVTLNGLHSIERLCLIGIGAIVLNGAVVGEQSIVAAWALVPEGMLVPPRSVVMGSPAKVRREVTKDEQAGLRRHAENYVRYKDEYRTAETVMMIEAVRGTRDILPDEVGAWHRAEAAARELLARYGYRELGLRPSSSRRSSSARGIGAGTDIVSKEMYTFADRDESSLTLRPEATAGIVRAVIEQQPDEHGRRAPGSTPIGPMFRRERPQKGRYRQFHQLDVEAFGFTSPTDRRRGGRRPRSPSSRPPGAGTGAGGQLRRGQGLPARVPSSGSQRALRPALRRFVETASAASRRAACASSTARCHRTRRRSTRCRGSRTTCARRAPSTSPRCGGRSTCSGSRTG